MHAQKILNVLRFCAATQCKCAMKRGRSPFYLALMEICVVCNNTSGSRDDVYDGGKRAGIMLEVLREDGQC